jgi:hypothetical protein
MVGKDGFITILEDNAKLTMTIRELRTLRKILGNLSEWRLVHDYDLSEAEVKHFKDLYRALSDFFTETA